MALAEGQDWTTALYELRNPPSWRAPRRMRRIGGGIIVALSAASAVAGGVVLYDPMRARLAGDVFQACAIGPGLFVPVSQRRSAFEQITDFDIAKQGAERCQAARLTLALHDAGMCAVSLHQD